MGQRPAHELISGPLEPAAIRAEMAETRLALEQKLGELKSRFTDPRPASTQRNRTVAKKKKAAAKSSAPKKAAKSKGAKKSAKKSSGAKSGGSRAKTGTTMKRAAGKAARKATGVLSEVLSGAAAGAIKGAAEVVEAKAKSAKDKR